MAGVKDFVNTVQKKFGKEVIAGDNRAVPKKRLSAFSRMLQVLKITRFASFRTAAG